VTVPHQTFSAGGHRPPVSASDFVRLDDGTSASERAAVAEEVPVAFVYGTRAHTVMMATPLDLEDLGVGFTLSEGIVADAAEIGAVQPERHQRGVELRIQVPAAAIAALEQRTRTLAGRTGCGLCGVEAIDDAVRAPRRVTSDLAVERHALWRAGEALDAHQPLNRDTRAIHGAGWATPDGELVIVREDVGRHNALDKVLGALVRARLDPRQGFLIVTSRASFELVQKAAALGVPILAAVSRPTGLAIRLADAAGICLVGLLRGRTANVYAHSARITGTPHTETPGST
jgi:FdhD protein